MSHDTNGTGLRRCALASVLAIGVIGPAMAGEALLVGNKSAASVYALDLASGGKLAQFETGAGPHEIEVSPDGKLAVVSDYGAREAGNSLTVIDWPARQVLRRIDLGSHTRPHGMRFLPDGKRLVATTEGSGSLTVVDVEAGEVTGNIAVGDGLPHMVALSPDGRRAYVTQLRSGSLSVVDLASGRKIRDATTGRGAEGLAVSPDGAEIWVGNRDDDTVTVVDAASFDIVATLESKGFPIRVTMTPDGRHVLVTNARAAALAVFDRAARKQVATIPLARDGAQYRPSMLGETALPIGALVAPDGRRVFVAISGGDEVAVIDAATWQVTGYWATGREPDALGIVGHAR